MFFLDFNITIFFHLPFIHITSLPHAVMNIGTKYVARGVTLIILLVLGGTIVASYSVTSLVTLLIEKKSFSFEGYLETIQLLLYAIGIFVGVHLVSMGLASLNRSLRGDVD